MTLAQFPNAGAIACRTSSASAKRIRFAPNVGASGTVLRTFEHPRRCAAIAEPIEMEDLPEKQGAADRMIAVVVRPDAASDTRRLAESWMGRASRDGLAPIVFALGGQKIYWRPGKAILQSPPENADDALGALVEFSFYESELRRMETSLGDTEAIAPADVARAHRIRFRDRKHWRRIGDTIEALYRTRLEYAQLESQLTTAPLSFSHEARQIIERLIEESEIYDRMEAFSNRLEACEDLYEGANDRIADHKWYVEGHWLEIGIVTLLVLEVILISADLYLKHWK